MRAVSLANLIQTLRSLMSLTSLLEFHLTMSLHPYRWPEPCGQLSTNWPYVLIGYYENLLIVARRH